MESEQQEAVQRRAYELWQAAGYTEGQALEHWLQAEREQGLPAGSTLPLELPIEPPVESDTPGGDASVSGSVDEPGGPLDRP
jgi:Protein of unknown function (DUF2934)